MKASVRTHGKWIDHVLPDSGIGLHSFILEHDTTSDCVIIDGDMRYASNPALMAQYRKQGKECADFGALMVELSRRWDERQVEQRELII